MLKRGYIERQPEFSFWLPTSTDKFYPDFIAQLIDGRILAVEYKGEHLINDDSREKELIGQLWEKSSNGQCLLRQKAMSFTKNDIAFCLGVVDFVNMGGFFLLLSKH